MDFTSFMSENEGDLCVLIFVAQYNTASVSIIFLKLPNLRFRTLKVNCIRLRPTWMYEDRHVIGDIPLHSLMIPGTHNAGAYDTNFGVSLQVFKSMTYMLICSD